jgi:hypothetical protein
MRTCVINGCNNLAKYGDTCGIECGRRYYQLKTSQKFETPKNPENNFGDITKKKLYYDYNDDIVQLIKTAIVEYKLRPQHEKALFFKNKIIPMVEKINGDTPKWNKICKHLKSQYNKPEYQFIIDAFDGLGMRIYSNITS